MEPLAWPCEYHHSFLQGYVPDSRTSESTIAGGSTYYHYGDMIIVFLSKVAPQYQQPIQTIGWSAGGAPAVDAGIRLNRAYKDARYAVNHVTELDSPCRWLDQAMNVFTSSNAYTSSNALFLTSVVDGEQCWHDHYWGYLSHGGKCATRSPVRPAGWLWPLGCAGVVRELILDRAGK